MTIAPLAKSYSKATFQAYVENVVEPAMRTWRPRGFVLHNTSAPTLAQFYLNKGKPLDGAQRIRNMWVSYQNQKWSGGPHLVVTDREIFTGNPLWLKGTHSPSWNSTFWGLEMAGDFATELMPAALQDLAVHAMAVCYAMLGHAPTNDTFHFHGEDPKTAHKGCPGKNAGKKADWIKAITARMAELHPGDCQCGEHAKVA